MFDITAIYDRSREVRVNLKRGGTCDMINAVIIVHRNDAFTKDEQSY